METVLPAPNLNKVFSVNHSGIPIGTVYRDGFGNVYQFVEYDDGASVNAVPGCPLGYTTGDGGLTVTTDISRSLAKNLCGVAMSSMTYVNKFGWMLTQSPDSSKVVVCRSGTYGALTIIMSAAVSAAHTKMLIWANDGKFKAILSSTVSSTAVVDTRKSMGHILTHSTTASSTVAKARIFESFVVE